MAWSGQRTTEWHCLTWLAELQQKSSKRVGKDGRTKYIGTRVDAHSSRKWTATAQMATKSCGQRPRACVLGPGDGWSYPGMFSLIALAFYRIRVTLLGAHPCNVE